MTALAPRWRLRFSFETPRLREAADLTAELRAFSPAAVRVRAAPRQLGGGRHWAVLFDTPSTVPDEDAVGRWEATMHEVARRHPGCRLLGRSFIPIG